jgi:hypothetical protein
VFSSSILTLVDDIKAFNAYQNAPNHSDALSSGNSTTTSHDYVPYVSSNCPCASSLT